MQAAGGYISTCCLQRSSSSSLGVTLGAALPTVEEFVGRRLRRCSESYTFPKVMNPPALNGQESF